MFKHTLQMKMHAHGKVKEPFKLLFFFFTQHPFSAVKWRLTLMEQFDILGKNTLYFVSGT